MKFGMLTAISFINIDQNSKEAIWLVECDCGKTNECLISSLTTGNTTSCGCARGRSLFIDITGERYGRLLVDGYVGRNQWDKIIWKCICDCGNIAYLPRSDLISGKVKSCGCYKREQSSIRFKNLPRPTGSDNPNWNPNISEEERIKKRKFKEYKSWRYEVYKRDSFKCFICNEGEGELNAHHIFSYNKYKNLRVNVNNGVTLCEFCHMGFHREYGKGNNNLLQFAIYIKELFQIDLAYFDDQILQVTNDVNNSDIHNFNRSVGKEFEVIFQLITSIKQKGSEMIGKQSSLLRR